MKKIKNFKDIEKIEKIKEFAKEIEDKFAKEKIINCCEFELDLIKINIFKELGKIEYEKIIQEEK